jgi:general secretion pathway protein N
MRFASRRRRAAPESVFAESAFVVPTLGGRTAPAGGRGPGGWTLGAGLLGGALLAGLLLAPAAWLADGLARASGERLLLAEARGTVWTGSAVLVLAAGAGSRDARALPGRLHWTLRPRWDASGPGFALALAQDCCLPQPLALRVSPGLERWRLSGPLAPAGTATPKLPPPPSAVVRWPADWLAGLGTPWNTMLPSGTLQLATPGFVLESIQGRLRFSGRAELQLLGMAARLSTLPWLGDYRLALSGDAERGDAATLELVTLRGPLQLTGRGQIAAGRVRFQGMAQAAPGSEAALDNLLNIIGRRQGAQALITIG